ncbi:putative ABC transporter [Tricladium varicosporioides]|nr:putative ABC transporter [Hymenoscyphus varicosporioides]
MHLILLILEFLVKPSALKFINEPQSPEELNGILGRVFFTWVNSILLQGYRRILVDQDLPPLSWDLKPEVTREKILQAWKQRTKPETRRALPLALIKCLGQQFLAAIMPRIFLIAFRYSQPILIKRSIRFVIMFPTDTRSNYGYWLIVSAVTVYIGLAVSTAVYQHRLNRLKLVTKSALVALIHDKAINSPSVTYDNGECTTLVSTDAESLDGIAEMFHEIWAQVVEVVIGIVLLAREVGWIWPLPLFLIFLCSYMSRFVARQLQPRQKAWNNATQSRVAATSSMLSSMKIIKMLGFKNYITQRITELRNEELSAASKLRWIMVYYNASANALGIFSPAITLAIFAVISKAHGRSLDTETAFTTIAILSMVTHPANMVMTFVPRVVASFAGFDRIQNFLLRPFLHDHRGRLPKATSQSLSLDLVSDQLTKPGLAILIQQLTIDKRQPILENVTMEVASGSIVIISGPVGSGKSTLLRTMLGEVIPAQGLIKLSTRRIAYCAQRPWLPRGTIKEVIHGKTDQVDNKWYHEVINMCCLIHDFNSLPNRDDTQIGSRGLNLSGGQRQRVALARAIFAGCDIILLDDSFSGLDGETENNIFKNLFGPKGLFRKLKSTVVLVSNSIQFFQAADQIFVLGDHGIKGRGTWQEIQAKASFVTKSILGPRGKDDIALSASFDQLRAQLRAKDEAKVDLARQVGDFALYGYYFRFAGLRNLLLVAGCTSSHAFFITIPQYWLQLWTESTYGSYVFYISGFLLLSAISWTSASGIMWSQLIRLASGSGMLLHQRLLSIVASAPLSYFSKTDNGSILNRFSQDIQLIDKQLPTALSNIGSQTFKLLVQAALLFVAQKSLMLSLPACILLVYIIQKVYLRTSRQLRFLELESSAAVFSSFLESVEGLETIRSFGWSQEVVQDNIRCVESAQRPQFLLLSLQRWLNIVLDLLAAAFATIVVAIAVSFRGHISGGQVGIALNILLVANTTLLRLVENWTTLEISLGAVARLKTLDQMTPSEGGNDENFEPPDNWPSKGGIEFKDVTASYHANSVALRNISLSIDAGQKFILCGRTGSGKSTLILTLLRILELQSGRIELDSVDISRVRLELLRQRCFITVSQDALLLSNETLRFNLDPEASLSNDMVISALTRTKLWLHFCEGFADVNGYSGVGSGDAIDEHPILDKKISLLQELSVGQCQLFALSRALIKVDMIRRTGVKPVILLDEVTSSLDFATESTIHDIIDEELTGKGHTVIIVAHRFDVLAEHIEPGRDVVALIKDGELQEIITNISSTKVKQCERP